MPVRMWGQYAIQDDPPSEDPIIIGSLWYDRDAGLLKVCTAVSPYTFTGVSGGGGGTVTSVAMTVPTGLSVSGSPVTTSGTLAVSLQSGYMIPGGGSSGQLLTSNGASAPTFQTLPIITLARGGTGAALVDPGVDHILFWDDSAGAVTWLAVSAPFEISGTVLQFDSTFIFDPLNVGVNHAQSGVIRIANNSTIVYRDSTNSSDVVVLNFTIADDLVVGSADVGSLQLTAGTRIELNAPIEVNDDLLFNDTVTLNNGLRLLSTTTNADTAGLAVYDVNGAAYRDFLVWTNGNAPDVAMTIPTTGTLTIAATSLSLTTPLPVASGGIGTGTASITAFNNITGFTASGATGTTSTNLVFSTSPSFETTITVTRTALVTTSTDGAVIDNSTAATSGVTVQISPRVRISGRGWDTDDAVSRTVSFFLETLPVTGNTVNGTFQLGYINPATSAITYPMSMGQQGSVTFLGSVTSGSHVTAATTDQIRWGSSGRAKMTSPADGQININNSGITAGVGFDFATDAVLKIRTRAQTGYATVDALAYQLSGAASLDANGLTLPNADDIILGTGTGTKIGTSTSQKLGFYNATPIVQGASVADASGGAVIDAEARTAINALISRIEATGLIATV